MGVGHRNRGSQVKVYVRFYTWEGDIRPVGAFSSLKEACWRLRLPSLRRDHDPDLLADLGASRAYSRGALDGVWVAYPWRPPPRERRKRTPAEPLPWPRTAGAGEMRVHAQGEYVECHVCGEWFRSVGHHARWKHRLSPEGYRRRFGLNRRTPLCAPHYSQRCRLRNWRLKLHQHIRPYQFSRRPAVPPRLRRLEARRNISAGRRLSGAGAR